MQIDDFGLKIAGQVLDSFATRCNLYNHKMKITVYKIACNVYYGLVEPVGFSDSLIREKKGLATLIWIKLYWMIDKCSKLITGLNNGWLLPEIFGRPVDLVEREGLRNPFRKRSILNGREVIYAAPRGVI